MFWADCAWRTSSLPAGSQCTTTIVKNKNVLFSHLALSLQDLNKRSFSSHLAFLRHLANKSVVFKKATEINVLFYALSNSEPV